MIQGFGFILGTLVWLGSLGSLGSAASSMAKPDFTQLEEIGTARVIAIVDGDTIVLDTPINGSREVRLVGIQAPKLPLGRKDFIPWPLGEPSKQTLSTLALHKDVILYTTSHGMDRHGRLLAHLKTTDGVWLQGMMLSLGMARVYSLPDNRQLVREMLTQETQARLKKLGIWDHSFYAVRTPQETAALVGRFEVIEGKVLHTTKVKNIIHLNFGEDWRTDFTLSIEKKNWKIFKESTPNLESLLSLTGKNIRVRGWLKDNSGPSLGITHPEQIEILN